MTSISSTRSLNLDLPPSCIAFCPTQPRLFVVGTYHLHDSTTAKEEPASSAAEGEASDHEDGAVEAAQKRSGSLILYELLDGDEIIHVATEPTPDFAILDAQWSPHTAGHGELLAVATSTGSLALYDLGTNDHGSKRLVPRGSKQICEASTLVLSLAWHPSRADVVGVTLSDGRVCLCACESSREGRPLWADEEASVSVTTVHEHSLEAWALAFTGRDDDGITGILSGGDDLTLQLSTVDESRTITSTPRWQDRRIHQAGVTAIFPLDAPNLIVTGSYDDHIRLIAAPSTGRRRVLAEVHLGGGVWRLKALVSGLPGREGAAASPATTALSGSTRSLFILASCMHAGTRILKLSCSQQAEEEEEESWAFKVLARFEEHKSMNYGSDMQPSEGSVRTIVSTSFYDRLLCLWRFDVGAE
ncbi:hypothetical protein B0A55_11547 [Friedmanniomyces simplex]|uniref:Anaphase-promoting complex subunit 4 WD40 domain-containing protein n=1 Tax=Friedmanniomyces simplex TaxID=329884 RepID=A0A4U0WHE2_9PEZI|nr:hypothetical protein B0A55_11547 [Friedmanniomyces simplex]